MNAEYVVLLNLYLKRVQEDNDWDTIESNTPTIKDLALLWKETMQSCKKYGYKNSDKLILSSILHIFGCVKYKESENIIVPIVKHSIFATNINDYEFIVDCMSALDNQLNSDGEKIIKCFNSWTADFYSEDDYITRFKCLVILNYLVEKIENKTVIHERVMNMSVFEMLTRKFHIIEDNSQLVITQLIIKVLGNISFKSSDLSEHIVGLLLSLVLDLKCPLVCRNYALSFILDSIFLFPSLLNCSIEMTDGGNLDEETLLERLESILMEVKSNQMSISIAYALSRLVIYNKCADYNEEITSMLLNRYLSLNTVESNENIETMMKMLHFFFVEMSKTKENRIVISNTVIWILSQYFNEIKNNEINNRFQDLEYDLLSDASSVSSLRTSHEDKKNMSKVKRSVRFLMNHIDDDMKEKIIDLSIKNIENNLKVSIARNKIKSILGV